MNNSSQSLAKDVLPEDILIVDDAPDSLKLLRDLIKGAGYRVRSTDDGELALRTVKARQPILILLDIRMPGISGLEVCNWLKADPASREIPVIFISALDTPQDKLHGFAAGGIDYITKPFNESEVLARVNTHVSLRQAQLTQKIQAQQLLAENHRRIKAEADLQLVQAELEARVQLRTRELSEANLALQASEQRYSDLYNNSPDMYVSVEAATALIKQCNQTIADKLGYSKAEIIGKTIFELYHPDCMADVQQAFHSFVEKGEVHNAELQLKRKDGSKIDVNLNVSSVRDDKGKVLYSRSCWIDISQRKETEKELVRLRHYLQNIFDSMPSVLIGLDPDACVDHWSRGAERFSGIAAAVAQGKRIDQLVPLLSGHMHLLTKAFRESQPQRLQRVSYRIHGEPAYLDIVIYPLVSNSHEGIVIRIDDVTERVRVEEIMIQTEKMMSVGGLATGMAHEINNPLGGILQGQQNIVRRFSPQLKKNKEVADTLGIDLNKVLLYMEQRQILRFIDNIADAGKRAASIVDNMLHFSRSDKRKQFVDIPQLLEQILELAAVDYDLKMNYDFRSIELKRDYAPELPQVPCIWSEIEQVVLNILRNSAQALGEPGHRQETARIIVRATLEDKRLRIDIEDNGIGMDEKSRRRAFEPFFTTKPVGLGTGLGLSVAYFIITNIHGGEMLLESKPGRGTTVSIRLPIG